MLQTYLLPSHSNRHVSHAGQLSEAKFAKTNTNETNQEAATRKGHNSINLQETAITDTQSESRV